MNKEELTIVLEVEDIEYGKVQLAFNQKLQEVCIIDGKIENNPNIIYEIKLRNNLCRKKEYEHLLD